MKEQEDSYATKMKEAKNLKEKAAEQYIEGFDKAINQGKFLYADMDVSSYGYFKEIRDGQLVDKPLPGANVDKVEGRD